MCEIGGRLANVSGAVHCRRKYESAWKYGIGLACEFDDLREAIRARVELRTSGFCAVFCK